ncbi:hypothetical protein PV735_05475 [Streptomyces turgidiscabies]|uniref:Uncharacterized protein n=1 Tax=Streptomyces turgidiscabies (strain Car8) TaxID=698760 RepID=L7FIU7_STRT8|nr:hypothetical protein [Streptomyces turgidiscabies]ELP71016.1 hypothetical protein STRTUCAR8_05551 [Streptomyces turgidiscabies Car8]MDX3492140.1 hypothetical protein [Streptomyces turgidiscabies]
MTGPEHYREAERHLSAASFTHGPGGGPVHPEATAHHLAMAQVHAQLAAVAAHVTSQPVEGHESSGGIPDEDWDDWMTVIHPDHQPTTTEEN